jgi:DNA-binding transcriptional ArsR family regulator
MVTIERKQSEAVFRASADPTRREILRPLRDRERTAGGIASDFRTSRPAISKHLGLLRRQGLVVTRKSGTARICQLNGKPLRAVSEWLRDNEPYWDEKLRNLKQFVEENP